MDYQAEGTRRYQMNTSSAPRMADAFISQRADAVALCEERTMRSPELGGGSFYLPRQAKNESRFAVYFFDVS